MGCTPLFLNALPHSTRYASELIVSLRSAPLISSTDSSSPPKYFSSSASSVSATASSSLVRYSSDLSSTSAGISMVSYVSPSLVSPRHTLAFISTRSTTPSKSPSEPIGSWIGMTLAPRRSSMVRTEKQKSAPILSILLTKQMRGTSYLSAWRQTCSDCGSTPSLPSNTATAPSRTRRLRSTSTVKSTCPGVSMMLIWLSFQKQVVAAEVMVIPRSCSCSIQSMVAAPSWTSPILCDFPV